MAEAARKDTGARGLAAAFKAEAETAAAESKRASASEKPATASAGKNTAASSDAAGAAMGFGEGIAVLRGRIEIDLDNRIPSLDSFRASAFMAQDKGDPGRKIFALVCDPKVPIRGKPLDALRGRLHKNLLSVVVDGVISPKGVDQSRLAIVFDRPIERTLADLLVERQGRPVEERAIMNEILPQLLAGLRELEEIGVTHRGIRPENIFYADDSRETLVLGDFLTVPPGRMQAAIYEPIESTQAMPEGHGIGTSKSDIYALGVTMLTLLTGIDPRTQWEDSNLIAERLTNGSYTAIIKEARLPPAIQELLRGTMSDDVEARWDIDEVDGWIRGRRSSPQRIVLSRRATQPLDFIGRAITYDLELADAFFRNPVEARQVIRTPEFEEWISTGLQDKPLAANIQEIAKNALLGGKGGRPPADLMALTILAMQPHGPLRLGDISVSQDGIGPLLAEAFGRCDEALLKSVVGLLSGRLPGQWMDARRNAGGNAAGFDKIIEIKDFISKEKLGLGPERCLYELNSSLPCQSALVSKYWVTHPRDLLPALDQAVKGSKKPTEIIDSHIAGFLAMHSDLAATIMSNAVKDNLDKLRLSLELYGFLQQRLKIDEVPNLTKWMAGRFDPIIRSYHSRTKRQEMKEKVAAVKGSGVITNLLILVREADSEDSGDSVQFKKATAQYAQHQADLQELVGNEDRVTEMGRAVGGRAANSLAMVLMLLSFGLVLFGFN